MNLIFYEGPSKKYFMRLPQDIFYEAPLRYIFDADSLKKYIYEGPLKNIFDVDSLKKYIYEDSLK